MIQKLIKSWSLLVLCAIFDAMVAFIILFMLSPGGALAVSSSVENKLLIEQLGVLALAAGVCTIAAGIWNLKKASSWLLVMNGVACSAVGTMVIRGMSRPVTFRSIAVLIVAMAVSIGAYELAAARTLRRHPVDEWLLAGAGVLSVAFAAVFLGFVFRWIKLEPSPSAETFYWLGSYFAFSAMCMLWLARGQLRPGPAVHRQS